MEEKDVHEIRDLTGLEEEEPLKLKKRKKDLLDEISSIQNGFLKKSLKSAITESSKKEKILL